MEQTSQITAFSMRDYDEAFCLMESHTGDERHRIGSTRSDRAVSRTQSGSLVRGAARFAARRNGTLRFGRPPRISVSSCGRQRTKAKGSGYASRRCLPWGARGSGHRKVPFILDAWERAGSRVLVGRRLGQTRRSHRLFEAGSIARESKKLRIAHSMAALCAMRGETSW